nr:CHAD domain-containing protein [Alsobacter ponti]
MAFRVPDAALEGLAAFAAFGRPRRLVSTYWDTADFAFRQAGVTLRVRQAGRRRSLGVKWRERGHGLATRAEREVDNGGDTPDLGRLEPDLAEYLAGLRRDAPLAPAFVTTVLRRTALVDQKGGAVEMALDQGWIVAGERRARVRDCECELKDGDLPVLFDLAGRIVPRFGLRLLAASKGERGYALAAGPAGAVKALPVPGSAETMEQLLEAALGTCVTQFVRNWPAFLDGANAEALHQLRVALRRLRALLSMFHHEVPAPALEALRGEAARLAKGMADAREWDVLAPLTGEEDFAELCPPGGIEQFAAALGKARRASYAGVVGLLEGPDATGFVLAAEGLAARRGWRDGRTDDEVAALDAPAAAFARRTLKRLRRRVLKRGKGLARLTDAELHRVRVALKALRYGVDTFAPLLGHPRKTRRFAAIASHLQDVLGEANDAATLGALVGGLRMPARAAAGRATRELAVAWFEARRTSHRSNVHAAWRAFKKADIDWL